MSMLALDGFGVHEAQGAQHVQQFWQMHSLDVGEDGAFTRGGCKQATPDSPPH